MDNVKGSLICDNLCSNISTVLIDEMQTHKAVVAIHTAFDLD